MPVQSASKRAATGKLPQKVFIKTAHLMKEGKSRNQALGEAAGMMRAGRLTEKGEYIRGKR